MHTCVYSTQTYTCILSFIRIIIYTRRTVYTIHLTYTQVPPVPGAMLHKFIAAKSFFYSTFFLFPPTFLRLQKKKKKKMIWLSNVSALVQCQRCNLGNMKPIQACKCIPLYHMCASRINFCMPSCVLNVTGGKRKALSVFQPTQFWQFSADVG